MPLVICKGTMQKGTETLMASPDCGFMCFLNHSGFKSSIDFNIILAQQECKLPTNLP